MIDSVTTDKTYLCDTSEASTSQKKNIGRPTLPFDESAPTTKQRKIQHMVCIYLLVY